MCSASWNDRIYHQYILNVHPTATVLVNYMWDSPILSMHTSLHQLYCLLLSWWNKLEEQMIWDCAKQFLLSQQREHIKEKHWTWPYLQLLPNCYPQCLQKSIFPLIKATFIQEVKITAVIFLMENSASSSILFPGSCLFPIKVQGLCLECDFVSVAKLGIQCLWSSFLL